MRKFLILTLFTTFLLGFFGCNSENNNNNKEKTCLEDPTQEKCKQIKVYDVLPEDNIIYVDKDQEFKILQISDLHLGPDITAGYANSKPELTYNYMRFLVENNNPDLIILTGDMLFHSSAKADELRAVMDEFKTPWTYVFGNHDGTTMAEKNAIINKFSKSEYCIFKNEYENAKTIRMGDHLIQLREKTTNKLVYAFYMFDSGMHSTQSGIILPNNKSGYESVWEDQLEHYETVMTSLNARYNEQEENLFTNVPHAIFQHIAVEEFVTAYDEAKANKKVLYGTRGETECNGLINTGEFELVKKMGATSMFIGHDHINTYAVMYKDLLLAYGGQTGYANDYYGDNNDKNGVLITINSNRTITSKLVNVK